jgi:hypothetical protein
MRHLQYEEIIAGMGYEINRKQQTQNHNSSNEGKNKEEEGDDHNSDIEHTERRRAAIDSACWFVPRSGNMGRGLLRSWNRLAKSPMGKTIRLMVPIRTRQVPYISSP